MSPVTTNASSAPAIAVVRGPRAGGVVGEHLEQQAHGVAGLPAAHEHGERLVEGHEALADEVVAGVEVGLLVGEDGAQLVGREGVERRLGDHHPRGAPGHAVGEGHGAVEDAQHGAGPGAADRGAALGAVEQVDHVAVPGAAPAGAHAQQDEDDGQAQDDQPGDGRGDGDGDQQRGAGALLGAERAQQLLGRGERAAHGGEHGGERRSACHSTIGGARHPLRASGRGPARRGRGRPARGPARPATPRPWSVSLAAGHEAQRSWTTELRR